MMIRTYSELIAHSTFEDRFEYLSLRGYVGESTFGFDRYLNQRFYNSRQWKQIRDYVIVRDKGCDLGIEGRDIFDGIRVHHMNPITPEDLEHKADILLDPEFLISTSLMTHNAIHFGSKENLFRMPTERRRGDTVLW